jgi:alpha-L-fucosidase 2
VVLVLRREIRRRARVVPAAIAAFAALTVLNAAPLPQHPAPAPMSLVAPIDTWDEAVPLGDGLIGALLWGQGNIVRLSLDRGDLWDLRRPEIYSRPDWNYQTIQKLKAEKNQAEMNRLFDTPYDAIPYPTKLPAGRVELRFPDGAQVSQFDLDLKTAEARARFVGVSPASDLRVFVDDAAPVVLVSLLGAHGAGADMDLIVTAPSAVAKLGYPPATPIDADGYRGYVQEAATGLRYGVLAKWRAAARSTLAITVFRSTDGSDPLPGAKATLDAALADGYDKRFAEHTHWWQNFWATSSVTIPDKRLQQHYNLSKYFYGAASRVSAPPMPLQGVWTADGGSLPPWKGDYHNDLNTQMTYVAYQAAGLFQEGESYLRFMSGLLPEFRTFAREFYGVDGAVVPGVMTLTGQAMGGWGQYSLSPTNGAWVSHLFARHWRYTRDAAFLEHEAYPFCSGIATALAGLLKESPDGFLRLPLSTSPEIFDNSMRAWLPPMSNYDLALVRGAFSDMAELETARRQPAAAKRWTELSMKLPKDVVDPATGSLMFADGLPYDASHRHFSHAMAIYPLGQLANDLKLMNSTIDVIKSKGSAQWVGYSFSWFSAMLARAGRADEALDYLKKYERSFTLRNGFHANGEQTRDGLSDFHYRPVTLEGNFLAMEAIHEMLLQSDGGVIRLFPAVSAQWKDVSFDRLRAEGGFIVSAERKDGRMVRYVIEATVDGLLRFQRPGDGQIIEKPMKAGQVVVFADPPLRAGR